MPTPPKLPVRPARQARTTLKSSKLPTRQFKLRHPVERKQWIMKRWQEAAAITRTQQ